MKYILLLVLVFALFASTIKANTNNSAEICTSSFEKTCICDNILDIFLNGVKEEVNCVTPYTEFNNNVKNVFSYKTFAFNIKTAIKYIHIEVLYKLTSKINYPPLYIFMQQITC
jgi:hypothetical protein